MRLLSFFTKLLSFLPPEVSHNLALKSLEIIYKIGFLGFFLKLPPQDDRSFSKSLKKFNFSTRMPNHLGIAAGLDKNGDHIDSLASLGVGFIEIGTVTPRPQDGNDKPRLFRDKKNKALVNRMGFNNKGVDYLVEKVKKSKTNIPIGISIGKNFDTPIDEAYKDYLKCLDKVYAYSDYVAVNISSPNTENLRDLSSKKYFDDLLGKLKDIQLIKSKEYNYVPLFVKISPDESEENLLNICNSIQENSIDGLICTNTSLKHDRNCGNGGISGAPLTDSSTQVLTKVRSIMGEDFPIIASGGVMTVQDYKNKIKSGANLVQIYTGFIYSGPKLIEDVINSAIN